MKYTPKDIPEEINVTPVHPLVNFAYLLATVMVASVVIYAGLGFVAGQLVSRIDSKTEQKIGQVLLPVAASSPLILEDKRTQYLEQLLTALQSLSHRQNRPPLTVHLVDTTTINAVILPGGNVLITTGLLQAVESKNELHIRTPITPAAHIVFAHGLACEALGQQVNTSGDPGATVNKHLFSLVKLCPVGLEIGGRSHIPGLITHRLPKIIHRPGNTACDRIYRLLLTSITRA